MSATRIWHATRQTVLKLSHGSFGHDFFASYAWSDSRTAAHAIGLAFLANVVFKLGVLAWYNGRLARHVLWPLAAALAAGGAALALT